MANQTVPDLKELIKQAAEIAGHVPENMQVAAFNRALDLLSAAAGSGSPTSRASAGTATSTHAPKPRAVLRTTSTASLVEKIDSTQHPGVRTAKKVLDRSLMILQIALTQHGIDGLSPGEVSRILTDKFRLNTSDAAVRMSLGAATNLVNRVQRDNGYIYRIMGPGEEYLAHLGELKSSSNNTAATVSARTPRRKKAGQSTAERGKADGTKTASKLGTKAPVRDSRPSGGLGPKAAILSLVGSGFFATPKTGPQVQEFLRTKRGFSIGTAQLRLAMLRLVRDGSLERGTNGDGHYEYKKP